MALATRERERDSEIAAALRQELQGAGHAERLTVRSLRDRFERGRLSAAGRAQIARALDQAGVGTEPDLARARLDDELVLRLVDEDGPTRHWWQSVLVVGSRAWKVTVAVLGLLGTLTGLYAFIESRQPKPPRALAGDLNLAVAPFAARGSHGDSRQGEALADVVGRTLRDQLDRRSRSTEILFDLAPPPPLEPIEGATAEQRAAAAERAARRINAHVVVFGTVAATRDRTVVAPSFYISRRALSNAEELVGDHQLGAAIEMTGSLPDSVTVRVRTRKLLAERARTLSDFVVGLSHFDQREYGEASRWFRQAARTSVAEGGGARELFYLFLGHAAGRAGDLDGAQRFYERSLAAQPGYVRARFGLAEVQFQRAHGGCRPGKTDAGGLGDALNRFRLVERQHQPYGALLGARARFNQGRVLLCLSQAGIEPRWSEAQALFTATVATFERGEDRLRDEAAESLAGIGLIRLPTAGEPKADAKLRDAATSYERALRVGTDVNRRALFSSMLGYIYGRLGRREEADRAYRRAVELDPDARDRARYERARTALREG